MNIWHVENKQWTKLRLWRINSNNFRVIESGAYAPILTNANYILMNKKYSSLFKSLDSQVSITAVKINDFATEAMSEEYVELKGLNDISQETVNTIDSSGQKLWKCYENLFISGNLKEEMFRLGSDELTFSPGFSMFAGINANAGKMGL